jgi:S1-C subfamily serine protease
VNLFDLAVVVILIVALVVGFRSGAVPQMVGLLGAVAFGGIAVISLPALEETLAMMEPSVRAFVVLVGILFSVGVGEALGSAIGRSVAGRLGEGIYGKVDRVLGAFVGAAQALLIIWLTGGLLAAGPSPTLAAQAQKSFVLRGLTGVLPAPTELAGELARLLNNTALPDLFIGLEPIPAAPVELPDDPLVRQLAREAIPSIVKVTASTCDAVSLGTGFVIDRGYVVTNAHVVAGARTIRVSIEDELFDMIPVLFDSEVDVALLYSSQLRAPALPLSLTDPERGDIGATFGFPGGGALDVQPAAVASAYEATGRDIYSRKRVTRSILEIRAEIDQGDSGGPLVLANGTVGGVVFAEARTDEQVGYALTPSSVRDAIEPALGETSNVKTGACIH